MDLHREEIFSTSISTGSYSSMIQGIINLSDTKPSSYVCFANVHMVVEAYKDKAFSNIVNNADIVTPDGKPLTVFLKLFHKLKQDRVAGMDVFADLLREAERHKKSVYFYGTTDDVLNAIVSKAKTEFPGLAIAGSFSPPFRALSENEREAIITNINNADPDFVFVALGCPKQEKWMADHKGKIKACMLGVGQAFHTYAGTVSRSPKWMQDFSLEWAYRLYKEPGRLWKRYLFTNSYFLFLVFKRLLLGSEAVARTTS